MVHAPSTSCRLLLLLCMHQILSKVTVDGQFLKTTCPAVSSARCPGLCATPSKGRTLMENGYCNGQQCRKSNAQQESSMFATAETLGTSRTVVESADASNQQSPAPASIQQPTAGSASPPSPVPQRVQPDEYADKPVETPEQQQAIVARLKSMYDSQCVNEDSCSSSDGSSTTVRSTAADVKRTAKAPYSGPDSQVERTLTYLSNTKIKIGLDMDRAGAISWLSSPVIPAPWRNQNLVNVWDQGRLLQQSYYGCVDGSCWATNPWLYNPVQGGNWENKPGMTVKKVVKPGQLYVEGYGRNWGKGDLIKELLLTSDVTLKDNYATVKFSAKYTGTVTHPYMTQEVPAVFVDRRFSVLAYYDGAKPWSNDADITYAFPAGRNMYARPTEFWAAWIDPVTGWGVGVFSPVAWMGITAYRIGEDGSDKPWDCSYFAHTIRMQLHPGLGTYRYTTYITIGKLDSIRATFYKLQRTPGVMPAKKAGTDVYGVSNGSAPESQLPAVPGFTDGQPTLGHNPKYGLAANYSRFDNVITEESDDSDIDGAAVAQGGTGTDGAQMQGGDGTPALSGASHQRQAGAKDSSSATDPDAAASKSVLKNVVGPVVAAFVGCALLVGAAVGVARQRAYSNRQQMEQPTQGQPGEGAAAAEPELETVTPQRSEKDVRRGTEVIESDDVVAAITTPGVLTRSQAALARQESKGVQ